MRAGWISGVAYNRKGIVLEWTELGTNSTKQFRGLFNQLGKEMFADELAAFLVILDTMSPGGTEQAESARIK